MINKDWKKRFNTLADRLAGPSPSMECAFAVSKFKEIHEPKAIFIYKEDEDSPLTNAGPLDVDQLANTLVNKFIDDGLTTAILGAAILNK